jgi:O-antigen/teichoic acid export membrane protein
VLLAHVFSVRDIGISATAVSATALITTIAQLGITYSLPRYLPNAQNRTAMINTLFTAVLLVALLCSVVFLALPYARKFDVLGGGLLFALVFIGTAVFQSGSTVLSSVLVADRSSDKVATYGTVANLFRLVSPPVFSFLGSLGSFVARVAADVVSFVLYGTVLVRRGHRFRPAFSREVTREIGRFSAGMYSANLIGGLPQLLLPLIALSRVGAQQAAYWSIATSISAILFSLPSMVATALLPEVSFRPTERRALLRRAALLTVAIVAPALVIAFFGVPIVLAAFGSGYTSGTLTPVRWLIGAGFITILNAVSGAILFIAKKSTMITVVNVANAVIVLGLVAAWATSATDIAIAWAVGDVANTLLFAGFAFLALREVGGSWEKLGDQPAADVAAPEQAPESFPQSHVKLVTVTAQQRAVDMYKPQSAMLTTSMELFSVAALGAAERQREQQLAAQAMDGNGPQFSADSQRRALDMLFSLADRQRAAKLTGSARQPSATAEPAESQAHQRPAEASAAAEEAAQPEEDRADVAEVLHGKDV